MNDKRNTSGINFSEIRQQMQHNVKQAKINVYQSKRQEVNAVKEQLQEYRAKKQNDLESDYQQKKLRSKGIKQQVESSNHNYKDFLLKKQSRLQEEFNERVGAEKKRIYELEIEAQKLEKIEELLIKELQETQEEEKQAYRELEEAMVIASQSKKDRLGISQGFNDSSSGKEAMAQMYSSYTKSGGIKSAKSGRANRNSQAFNSAAPVGSKPALAANENH